MTGLPPMLSGWLADAILVLHVGVVAFVVLGAVAVPLGAWRGWRWVRRFGWRLAHVLLMGVIAVQAWLGALCPLTVWERALRTQAGEAAYAESFVEHRLSRLIFFEAPWWVFVAAYSAFALFVLLLWRWAPPQRMRR
jgi:hypothetical protein